MKNMAYWKGKNNAPLKFVNTATFETLKKKGPVDPNSKIKPNATIEERVNATVEEKVDEVVNNKTGEGLV